MSQFTVFFVRHGQSTYSDDYPDLTSQGIKQVERAGTALKNIFNNDTFNTIRIVSSPAIRAQGTAHLLAQKLQYSGPIEIETLIKDMTIFDKPKAMKIFENVKHKYGRIEKIYDYDPIFEDSSIFEPRAEIRKRFFEYLMKLITETESQPDQTLIAVSHFEILNHFVQTIWPQVKWFDYANILKIRFSLP